MDPVPALDERVAKRSERRGERSDRRKTSANPPAIHVGPGDEPMRDPPLRVLLTDSFSASTAHVLRRQRSDHGCSVRRDRRDQLMKFLASLGDSRPHDKVDCSLQRVLVVDSIVGNDKLGDDELCQLFLLGGSRPATCVSSPGVIVMRCRELRRADDLPFAVKPVGFGIDGNRPDIAARAHLVLELLGRSLSASTRTLSPRRSRDACRPKRVQLRLLLLLPLFSERRAPYDPLCERAEDLEKARLLSGGPSLLPPVNVVRGGSGDQQPVVEKQVSDERARLEVVGDRIAAPEAVGHRYSFVPCDCPSQRYAHCCSDRCGTAQPRAADGVGFANSGGLVFVDESAEEVVAS